MVKDRRPPEFLTVQVPTGEVRILVERCKGCGFCIEYCPRDVLRLSEGFNRKGYHPPEVVDPSGCVNCNLCEMICPDFAIFSVPASPEASIPPGAAEKTQDKKGKEAPLES